MNWLRTVIDIPRFPFQVDYTTPTLLIGSCFSDNVGAKLSEYKFPVIINPFGVLYNPLSIKNALKYLLTKEQFTEDELDFYNDLWFSFSHHSSFSSPDKEKCLHQINQKLQEAKKFLIKTKCLMITFGTSWLYIHKERKSVVANCHKIPQKQFIREFVSADKIVHEYIPFLHDIVEKLPEIKIIFTVSPIRHWKDGAVQNQQSKANLIVAIRQILAEVPGSFYFPSYEIMMDDLRDYRFYEDNMLHPNSLAIKYIWEKFTQSLIDPEYAGVMKEVEKINNAANHRPFNPNSSQYKQFVKQNISKIEALNQNYPFLDFEEELIFFKKALNNK